MEHLRKKKSDVQSCLVLYGFLVKLNCFCLKVGGHVFRQGRSAGDGWCTPVGGLQYPTICLHIGHDDLEHSCVRNPGDFICATGTKATLPLLSPRTHSTVHYSVDKEKCFSWCWRGVKLRFWIFRLCQSWTSIKFLRQLECVLYFMIWHRRDRKKVHLEDLVSIA